MIVNFNKTLDTVKKCISPGCYTYEVEAVMPQGLFLQAAGSFPFIVCQRYIKYKHRVISVQYILKRNGSVCTWGDSRKYFWNLEV